MAPACSLSWKKSPGSSRIIFQWRYALRAQPTCVEANGLDWCYNDQACGEACDDVCAALGLEVIQDNQVWFEAQNSEAECQAISEALGLGGSIFFLSWSYGCLEDEPGNHTVGGGPLGRAASVYRPVPDSSSGPAGSGQTVTATVRSNGDPAPGVLVTFEVVSGPGAGITSAFSGTCSPDPGCFTGPDGTVSWTYTVYGVGTDTVTASFVNTQDTVITSAPVEVIWEVLPIPALSTWGLIAAAGLMGIAGYLVVRRRKAAV